MFWVSSQSVRFETLLHSLISFFNLHLTQHHIEKLLYYCCQLINRISGSCEYIFSSIKKQATFYNGFEVRFDLTIWRIYHFKMSHTIPLNNIFFQLTFWHIVSKLGKNHTFYLLNFIFYSMNFPQRSWFCVTCKKNIGFTLKWMNFTVISGCLLSVTYIFPFLLFSLSLGTTILKEGLRRQKLLGQHSKLWRRKISDSYRSICGNGYQK